MTAGRVLVLFWMGAAMAAIVWALSLPVWAWAVLAVAWIAQATRPYWENGDNVVAVLRVTDEFLIIQDRRTKSGESRAVALRDIVEVSHIGSIVAVRCHDDHRDGTSVGIKAASTLADRIREAVATAKQG
ncbi:hypothetical protein [Pseudosulfitobacter pseudonitzschiae]|uniref:hypothetical protein n=1 Tax=Pseudosulfitobacter pseudonitzschiae TaxID=1402135 RepID=UPI001AF100EE|nr:hypothetical protein [Pseudosulfitobacter pseudonitzschiae]MBM1865173.1 hypothetical protein [Pseudosulfitobacter pseudonitzschiae]MBM1928188.1 hypothetical protein [Pseudosulfitobacter pseudonitzschiae]MBM1947455.1 hypothetical protein [Pseudosulfitobacter pseudonitzschiae]MBM1966768.1 hypothetical protein [Pseudosulfitobacter pseudonitzschiae]MBM2034631.1 hypothetical protein [Pseudosulfitobacter pseudonitzschiae]